MVEFDLGRFSKSIDALDEDVAAEVMIGGDVQNPPAVSEEGWRQVSMEDLAQIPFDKSGEEELPY